MNYIELKIECLPLQPAQDILLHKLGEAGFESFTEEDFGLMAYISENDFNENAVTTIFKEAETYTNTLNFTKKIIQQQNWNEVWESSFKPITIGNKCIVKAPFHNVSENYQHTIEISPKMSFGTGHHETTYLMLAEMLDINFSNKNVLDMGSGTGILTILAAKLDAKYVDAVDIEQWAYENAIENFEANNVDNATSVLGDAHWLKGKTSSYDVVLANINRNILLNDMATYVDVMRPKAQLLLSGFYDIDVPVLLEKINKLELNLVKKNIKNGWCMLHLQK